MARNESSSAIIDGILKFLITGGVLSIGLLAPNALEMVDKPIGKLFDKFDNHSRERETKRMLSYMRRQGLITFTADDYVHGIRITRKGKKRSDEADIDNIKIPRPIRWDRRWRIVLFDIPERFHYERSSMTRKLRELGFIRLQQSAWIHPYPCRDEVTIISHKYRLNSYVSYLEVTRIDNEQELIKIFLMIWCVNRLSRRRVYLRWEMGVLMVGSV